MKSSFSACIKGPSSSTVLLSDGDDGVRRTCGELQVGAIGSIVSNASFLTQRLNHLGRVLPALLRDPRKCVGSGWHGTPSGVTMMTYMMVTHPSIITSHTKSFISTFCWLCPCRTFIRKTRRRSTSQPLLHFLFFFPAQENVPELAEFPNCIFYCVDCESSFQ